MKNFCYLIKYRTSSFILGLFWESIQALLHELKNKEINNCMNINMQIHSILVHTYTHTLYNMQLVQSCSTAQRLLHKLMYTNCCLILWCSKWGSCKMKWGAWHGHAYGGSRCADFSVDYNVITCNIAWYKICAWINKTTFSAEMQWLLVTD